LLDLDERFTVGERLDGGFAHLDADIGTNGIGQRPVGRAAKYLHNAFMVESKTRTHSIEWRKERRDSTNRPPRRKRNLTRGPGSFYAPTLHALTPSGTFRTHLRQKSPNQRPSR